MKPNSLLQMESKVQPISFVTADAFRAWLKENHGTSDGIWLRFFRKGTGIKTIVYAEALEEALCFGWIDSQVKGFDDTSYIQRFTPRRAKSLWSKRNQNIVAKLIDQKRMQSAGLKAIESAKSDGRWEKAYASPRNMVVPPDFHEALEKDKKAQAFFATLTKANRYAILWRIETAKKAETRARKILELLAMLGRGEKLH